MIAITFQLGALVPEVKPEVVQDVLVFGENLRTQDGSLFSTETAPRKLHYTLNFGRLTLAERQLLEQYCMALPDSTNATLVMIHLDRAHDGETTDAILGRVLNKVKILPGWQIGLQLPYDSEGLSNATLEVEEV